MSNPNYLTVMCGFCPWRETYSYFSDADPEKTCRAILREHIATSHDVIALKIFDDHVAKHSLNEEQNL